MAVDARGIAAGAAFVAAAAGILYTALAITRVRRFRASMKQPRAIFMPPVTILKPLHGREDGLYANLSSFCSQAYPQFQVVFGAADPNDPALEVARRVQRSHPDCDIEVLAGMAKIAANPKIGNVMGMAQRAKHRLIVVADSDIRVGRHYLAALASCFSDARVGAATCVYGGVPDAKPASRLGAMFVNDHFAPSVLVALALEPLTFCFGATMAVRRDVLVRIGGFEVLADHLGDDYRLGKLVARAGYRVALCPYVVRTSVSEPSMRSLWLHEVRWARTIRSVRAPGYAGSVVIYASAFAMMFAALSRSKYAAVAVAAFSAALRAALHLEAQKTFAPEGRATLWLIPVRDALSVGVWCAGFLGRNVTWRGDPYCVNGDGRMDPVPS